MGASTPLGFPGGWDKGLGDLGLGQGVGGLGVRGMMCGCKHTFRVSWGLGQGVRGLASEHFDSELWLAIVCNDLTMRLIQ